MCPSRAHPFLRTLYKPFCVVLLYVCLKTIRMVTFIYELIANNVCP